MDKLALILVSTSVSLIAQINLKNSSGELPTSIDAAMALGLARSAWLICRAAFFSGISLVLTWYCYKRFQFLELILVQSLSYVFFAAASYFYFHEPVTLQRTLAMGLILSGIGVMYL